MLSQKELYSSKLSTGLGVLVSQFESISFEFGNPTKTLEATRNRVHKEISKKEREGK